TVMSNGYRTLSQHLNDLKKENFSLKLRIYFLEERIQQKYEESSEDVYLRGQQEGQCDDLQL
uniref:Centrosomin N-terminal motif 1 domain-containing protein n=3 Tax=Ovalentaria TaxID=1489908 RepID=A0A3P9PM86_POERE